MEINDGKHRCLSWILYLFDSWTPAPYDHIDIPGCAVSFMNLVCYAIQINNFSCATSASDFPISVPKISGFVFS